MLWRIIEASVIVYLDLCFWTEYIISYTEIEYGLPSNIEQRFVPRAPKFYEQPQDQEFGRIDQITLGGGTTFGISKLSVSIVVTLTCRADAYPVADY